MKKQKLVKLIAVIVIFAFILQGLVWGRAALSPTQNISLRPVAAKERSHLYAGIDKRVAMQVETGGELKLFIVPRLLLDCYVLVDDGLEEYEWDTLGVGQWLSGGAYKKEIRHDRFYAGGIFWVPTKKISVRAYALLIKMAFERLYAEFPKMYKSRWSQALVELARNQREEFLDEMQKLLQASRPAIWLPAVKFLDTKGEPFPNNEALHCWRIIIGHERFEAALRMRPELESDTRNALEVIIEALQGKTKEFDSFYKWFNSLRPYLQRSSPDFAVEFCAQLYFSSLEVTHGGHVDTASVRSIIQEKVVSQSPIVEQVFAQLDKLYQDVKPAVETDLQAIVTAGLGGALGIDHYEPPGNDIDLLLDIDDEVLSSILRPRAAGEKGLLPHRVGLISKIEFIELEPEAQRQIEILLDDSEINGMVHASFLTDDEKIYFAQGNWEVSMVPLDKLTSKGLSKALKRPIGKGFFVKVDANWHNRTQDENFRYLSHEIGHITLDRSGRINLRKLENVFGIGKQIKEYATSYFLQKMLDYEVVRNQINNGWARSARAYLDHMFTLGIHSYTRATRDKVGAAFQYASAYVSAGLFFEEIEPQNIFKNRDRLAALYDFDRHDQFRLHSIIDATIAPMLKDGSWLEPRVFESRFRDFNRQLMKAFWNEPLIRPPRVLLHSILRPRAMGERK